MTEKPLEIELPVCNTCGQVSLLPGRTFRSKGGGSVKCIGPAGRGHPAKHMELRKFKEVTDASTSSP